MKRIAKNSRLTLHRETLRQLADQDLQQVAGGSLILCTTNPPPLQTLVGCGGNQPIPNGPIVQTKLLASCALNLCQTKTCYLC